MSDPQRKLDAIREALTGAPRLTDHGSEIALLALIAVGVLVVAGIGLWHATDGKPFDPSAYLVVLTLIVGAIKERWTQRSVDRMGQQLGGSQPATPPGPVQAEILNDTTNPVPVTRAS